MFDERNLEMVVTPELERGEKLLWTGKPSLRGIRTPSAVAFGVGVIWTCFTVNFIYMWHNDVPNHGDGPGGLFGMQGILSDVFFVPFVLIGFAAILSPIWFHLDAKRTVYGVTDKRVVIVRTGRSRKVQTFGPADLGGAPPAWRKRPTKLSPGTPATRCRQSSKVSRCWLTLRRWQRRVLPRPKTLRSDSGGYVAFWRAIGCLRSYKRMQESVGRSPNAI